MLTFLCRCAQIVCEGERRRLCALGCLAAMGSAPSVLACDLALALAVDVSGSVDHREYDIQMQGLADALRDGSIAEALVRAEAAIAVVQWTGKTRQSVSIDWTQVRDFDGLEKLADEVAVTDRRWRNFATAIGSALEFTIDAFSGAPDCKRRVIDVSGDGFSNEGPEPEDFKGRLSAEGITVNALAIEGAEDDLTGYYWENVIHGEGAFVVTANGYGAYPEKIRRKLLKEVVKQVSSTVPPENSGDDCGDVITLASGVITKRQKYPGCAK